MQKFEQFITLIIMPKLQHFAELLYELLIARILLLHLFDDIFLIHTINSNMIL